MKKYALQMAATYPLVADAKLVGTYDEDCKSGGGIRYDKVLEYRMWVKTHKGKLCCIRFVTAEKLLKATATAIQSGRFRYVHDVALVQQDGYYEPDPKGLHTHKGKTYTLIPTTRFTEFPLEWL